MAFNQRRKRYLAGWSIMLLAAIGVAIASRTLADLGADSVPHPMMILVLALLGGAPALSAVPWWRALDEMQKDAQLHGWYWGGVLGLTLGLLSAVVLGGPQSELVKGALLVGGAQALCFVAVWLGWRAIHRPRAS